MNYMAFLEAVEMAVAGHHKVCVGEVRGSVGFIGDHAAVRLTTKTRLVALGKNSSFLNNAPRGMCANEHQMGQRTLSDHFTHSTVSRMFGRTRRERDPSCVGGCTCLTLVVVELD